MRSRLQAIREALAALSTATARAIAEALGLSRVGLRHKMRRLGLDSRREIGAREDLERVQHLGAQPRARDAAAQLHQAAGIPGRDHVRIRRRERV